MNRSTLMIALAALIVGVFAATFALPPLGRTLIAKSDRLDGSETETAFLPERFGVPSSQQ